MQTINSMFEITLVKTEKSYGVKINIEGTKEVRILRERENIKGEGEYSKMDYVKQFNSLFRKITNDGK